MPALWIEQILRLSLELTQPQLLGLAFLLGSFTVATLSDLKRLSAQREFLEAWVLFALGVLAYDVGALWQSGWVLWQVPAVKWTLIALFCLLSWQPVGVLFSLARADVWALAAAASLLSPLLVVGLWIVVKVLALGLKPLLARGRGHWPFMPVVSLSVAVVMAVGLLAPGGELSLFAVLA